MGRAFVDSSIHRPEHVRLRSIVDADEPFLRELYASTRESELALVPWPAQTKQAFLAQQFDAQHKYYHEVYSDADFLLIVQDDRAIGRIYVHRTSGQISVIDIALMPAYRGRGIGSALFAELIDEAKATSREINLYVEPQNRAQRLYTRMGFRFVENRGAYDYLVWSVTS